MSFSRLAPSGASRCRVHPCIFAAFWGVMAATGSLPSFSQTKPAQAQAPKAPAAQPPRPASPTPAPPKTSPFETVPQSQEPTRPAPAAPKPAAPAAPGQALTPQPLGFEDVIEAIEFRGIRRVPQDTLRALIFTKRGDNYDEDAVHRDFMALWNTGRFDDIKVEREAGRNGLDHPLPVVERRVIRSINYDGNKSITDSEILDRFKERKVGLSRWSRSTIPTRFSARATCCRTILPSAAASTPPWSRSCTKYRLLRSKSCSRSTKARR